jgi:hypothetical protein
MPRTTTPTMRPERKAILLRLPLALAETIAEIADQVRRSTNAQVEHFLALQVAAWQRAA